MGFDGGTRRVDESGAGQGELISVEEITKRLKLIGL
jgi:hypothetical protein